MYKGCANVKLENGRDKRVDRNQRCYFKLGKAFSKTDHVTDFSLRDVSRHTCSHSDFTHRHSALTCCYTHMS